MANIIQLIQHLNTGGLEKMVVNLFRHSYFKDRMLLIAIEGDKAQCLQDWPELAEYADQIICLNKPAGFSASLVWQLDKIVRQHSIKLIHSHHIGPALYASLLLFWHQDIRHINTIHDAWSYQDEQIKKRIKLSHRLHPITFVADAEQVAKDFQRYTGLPVGCAILNGIDTCVFTDGDQSKARQQLTLPTEVTLLGCAARLEPGKGHKILINQLALLASNVHLALAGNGGLLNDLQHHSESLGLASRVHFLGNVHNMQTFYQAIDVFCLLSEREGLPLTILEAQASGKPIIATNVGAIAEVLDDELSLLIEPEQASTCQLDQAITSLMQSSKLLTPSCAQSLAEMAFQYDQLFDTYLQNSSVSGA